MGSILFSVIVTSHINQSNPIMVTVEFYSDTNVSVFMIMAEK